MRRRSKVHAEARSTQRKYGEVVTDCDHLLFFVCALNCSNLKTRYNGVMKKTGMQFSDVLDAVDALQFGEQEELIEIVRRRQAERERKRIVAQIKRSRREFA